MIEKYKKALRYFYKIKVLREPLKGEIKNGIWIPKEMLQCCKKITKPRRDVPYSLLHHQLSIEHIAVKFKIDYKIMWTLVRKGIHIEQNEQVQVNKIKAVLQKYQKEVKL
jgi:hypothetical protein